jgi:hypothetical protein
MKKAQFGVGIASGILLAPISYGAVIAFLLAIGFEGQNARDTTGTLAVLLLVIALNIALPVYICRQSIHNAPLFSQLKKVPLSLLIFVLTVSIGFMILQASI